MKGSNAAQNPAPLRLHGTGELPERETRLFSGAHVSVFSGAFEAFGPRSSRRRWCRLRGAGHFSPPPSPLNCSLCLFAMICSRAACSAAAISLDVAPGGKSNRTNLFWSGLSASGIASLPSQLRRFQNQRPRLFGHTSPCTTMTHPTASRPWRSGAASCIMSEHQDRYAKKGRVV